MRRFAGNESVDSFGGNALDLTTGGTGDDADGPNVFRTRRDGFYRTSHTLLQLCDQFAQCNVDRCALSEQRSFFFEEWL